MSTIYQNLRDLGFSEDEVNIYLYTLQKGPQTALNISQSINIPKLSTHAALHELVKRGIMSHLHRDSDQYYAAEHPKTLIQSVQSLLRERRKFLKDLEQNSFELEAMMSDERPTMRFFEGKQGLKTMQRDFLDSGVGSACMFYPFKDVSDVFTDEERMAVGRERRDKGIKIKVICTNKDKSLGEKHIAFRDELTEKKEIPFQKFPLASDITIYGNKIMMTSLRGKLHGVIVESESIAESLRSIFKLAYEAAENYNR